LRKLIPVLLVLLFCSTFSKAQSQNKLDVFGGYSYWRAYYGDPKPAVLNGWDAAITYYPSKHIGLTADLSGLSIGNLTSQCTESISCLLGDDVGKVTTQSYLFGPSVRFGLKNPKLKRFSGFAHQMFGVTHINANYSPALGSGEITSVNALTSVTGGGIDLRLGSHVSFRPVQIDYMMVQPQIASDSDTGESLNLAVSSFRYFTGIVFHL
jgi:hypothetical protein